MTTALLERPRRRRWRSRRHPPAGLVVPSAIVLLALATPLAYLLLEASGIGTHVVWSLLWRPLTRTLLWNTVLLGVVVTALCAVIGTLSAFCIERTDLPGRHVLAALLVVPFAIPDFVVSFAWNSIAPAVRGLWGAVLVMTLAVYPLVFLPVAAALRTADPSVEEAARSLGLGPVRVFFRVTLPQVRQGVLGGCVLVFLVVLAEFGAFEILGYQTFTTEIYTELNNFGTSAACALSIVLVALGAVVLLVDALGARRGRVARVGALAARPMTRHRLGRAKVPVLLAHVALVLAALGLPVAACCYWIVEGGHAIETGDTLWQAAVTTATYSGAAAAIATLAALPLALLVVRHPSRFGRVLERGPLLVLAIPGIVVAFALGYFSEHYLGGAGYQTAPLLVLAYAVLFFPLALVGVRAAVAHAPVGAEEAARSLGVGGARRFLRVTLPLVAPGLAAAFSLVFLAAVTELTATLLLIPDGVETLATQFWAYETSFAYTQAAPFALAIIAIAAVPSYVLGRFFDRRPATRRVSP